MEHLYRNRRRILRIILAASAASVTSPLWVAAAGEPVSFEVWKDPSCGCCNDWIVHMREHGFEAAAHDIGNKAMRARLGLPSYYGSCHTALIGGYVVEGHVPAADVKRLLREKPRGIGLVVPGMPVGSPGMDGPVYGARRDAYDTLLVLEDGGSRIFESH